MKGKISAWFDQDDDACAQISCHTNSEAFFLAGFLINYIAHLSGVTVRDVLQDVSRAAYLLEGKTAHIELKEVKS